MSRSCGCLGTRPNQNVELNDKRIKALLEGIKEYKEMFIV